jgi:adenosylmethionine-8-amino-7-oxononanoate aminotransferase
VTQSTANSSSLAQRDASVIWHPATHFCDAASDPALPIERAQGAWLYPHEGRPILDAISSWWTTIHGHGFAPICDAIAEQVRRLDHVMFAGFTHAPAVDLAQALIDHAPPGYGKVFYADCGSASIEVALKLSYQHHLQSGAPQRRRFAALENSYHGETLGALAVCGHDAYRATFAGLLPEVVYLPALERPNFSHDELARESTQDDACIEYCDRLADEAIAILHTHAHELAALIVEPLVQCAGRFRMHGPHYLRRVVEAAQALGIHVIADEIAVGFGRTGRLFASQWANIVPDLMCVSKGLSGGVLPLAATLVRKGFDEPFHGSPSRSFLHSHTYTGNPLACAAGLASLKALVEASTQAKITALVENLSAARQRLTNRVSSIVASRQCGTIVAFDLDPTLALAKNGEPARFGLIARRAARAHGVLLRPLANTFYWMPPYSLTGEELSYLEEATVATIETTVAELSR